MDFAYLLFLVLALAAASLLLVGVWRAWEARRGPQARRVQQRLQLLSAGGTDAADAPLVQRRALSDVPAIERVLLELPRIHHLDRFLVQSGLRLSVARFLGIAAAFALLGLAVAVRLGLPWYACVVVAVACAAAWSEFVERARVRRLRLIERQLPDALDMIARAMQAGHAFSSALRLAGTEGPAPIASELRTTFDEINYGIPIDRALVHLAERVDSKDLRYFVVGVVIQRETGGNLAEVLCAIAALVRERQKFAGTVQVLSAEGRLSAWILSVLPFVVGAAVLRLNREFIALLWTDPFGRALAGSALVLMAIGIWWMWHMVRIRI